MSHYATGAVWISNLDGEEDATEAERIATEALREAGYYATVDITAHPNAPLPGEEA